MSYERKHNRANGEDNRDGTDANASRQRRRRRRRRTTGASRPAGTSCGGRSWPPCCCRPGCRCCVAGDELGRTQLGNNNAYCQDNEISWLAWPYDRRDPAGPDPLLISLVSGLLRLRRRSPVLRRTTFFLGGRLEPGDVDSPVPGHQLVSAGRRA